MLRGRAHPRSSEASRRPTLALRPALHAGPHDLVVRPARRDSRPAAQASAMVRHNSPFELATSTRERPAFAARSRLGRPSSRRATWRGSTSAGRRFRKHQIDQPRITLKLFIADIRADAQNQCRASSRAALRSPFFQPLGIAGNEPMPMHDDEPRRTAGAGPGRSAARSGNRCASRHATGQCISDRHDPGITQIAEEPDCRLGMHPSIARPPCLAWVAAGRVIRRSR